MIPDKHVISNHCCPQQKLAIKMPLLLPLSMWKLQLPPMLNAPVSSLDGFAMPPAGEATEPPAAATLP